MYQQRCRLLYWEEDTNIDEYVKEYQNFREARKYLHQIQLKQAIEPTQ